MWALLLGNIELYHYRIEIGGVQTTLKPVLSGHSKIDKNEGLKDRW